MGNIWEYPAVKMNAVLRVCVCVCVCVHVCLCSSSPPLPRCIYNSFHAGVDHPGNGRLKFNINDPTFASCFATRYGAAEVAQ